MKKIVMLIGVLSVLMGFSGVPKSEPICHQELTCTIAIKFNMRDSLEGVEVAVLEKNLSEIKALYDVNFTHYSWQTDDYLINGEGICGGASSCGVVVDVNSGLTNEGLTLLRNIIRHYPEANAIPASNITMTSSLK